ncbi:MAG: PASTA domain-containing protein [Nitrospinae bacterium]|nr:PASTA domain-containing protein [Nitrospinota bacterium]
MSKAAEYLQAFALLLAVAVVSGILVMRLAMAGGGETVDTPDLRGKGIIAALETLDKYGLYLRVTGLEDDPLIPKDHVVSQDPIPGEPVKKGRDVKVVVSRGAKSVVTPDVAGSSVERAEAILARNGIKMVRKLSIYSEKPEGTVLKTRPGAQVEISKGGSVAMLVSAGPEPEYIITPDFTGGKLSEAMEKLGRAGLKVGKVLHETGGGREPGTVTKQEPRAGARSEAGSFVTLTVSEGPGSGGGKPESYNILYYTIPKGRGQSKVTITRDNASGSKEVYNGVHKPGDTISLLVEIQGKTSVRIYLDASLAEVRSFE